MKLRRPVRVVLGLLLLALFAICFFRFASSGPKAADMGAPPMQPVIPETPAEAPGPVTEPPTVPEQPPQPEAPETPEAPEAPVASEAPASVSTPVSAPGGLPAIDPAAWELLLVNGENAVGDYVPELDTLEGQKLDARIIESLRSFVSAARAQGLSVYLASGFRTNADQQYLYNRKLGQGISPEEAVRSVPMPGYSDHQTGLSCDITDIYREEKDSSLESTATYQWMSQHCHEYGFIVRYPDGKSDVTGIDYMPWHFRFVGVEAATYIMQQGISLEEFLDLYK